MEHRNRPARRGSWKGLPSGSAHQLDGTETAGEVVPGQTLCRGQVRFFFVLVEAYSAMRRCASVCVERKKEGLILDAAAQVSGREDGGAIWYRRAGVSGH